MFGLVAKKMGALGPLSCTGRGFGELGLVLQVVPRLGMQQLLTRPHPLCPKL